MDLCSVDSINTQCGLGTSCTPINYNSWFSCGTSLVSLSLVRFRR